MDSQPANLDALRIDRSAAVPQARRGGWRWLLAGVLVAGAGGWWWVSQATGVAVKTATVQGRHADAGGRTLLNASGYVTTRLDATVSSKVTGKVAEILVEEGMKVEQGQVLAKLDAANAEAGLRLAEAQLEAARLALAETAPMVKYTAREMKRFSELEGSKSVSGSDLAKAEAEAQAQQAKLERQQAEVRVAERQVDEWKQQVDDTIIRAPFAGVVTTKDSQPGEMISPMSAGGFTRTGICTLVDMASLEIEVDVGESFINRVKPGQPVEATLDAYPDWKIPGKVIAIIPTADRQKATVKVRVAFDKLDPRILPQMGVKVAFQSAEPATPAVAGDVLTVPRDAVVQARRARRRVGRARRQGRAPCRERGGCHRHRGHRDRRPCRRRNRDPQRAGHPDRWRRHHHCHRPMSPSPAVLVRIHNVAKTFRRGSEEIHVLADLELQVMASGIPRADGPLRFRQIHPAQPDRRPRPAERRHRPDRRGPGRPALRPAAGGLARPPHRVCVPVLQPAAGADRRAQRRAAAAADRL